MELFHLYLFVTIANAVDYLNHNFFLLGECHTLFTMYGLPHMSFNFPGELSHLVLCCHTMLFHFFFFWIYAPPSILLFHTLPLCCVDCHPFLLFSEWNFSSCECHAVILCVSIIFVWMSDKYPCVSISSKWTLYFVFFWIVTDPLSFLCMYFFRHHKKLFKIKIKRMATITYYIIK